MKPRLLTAALGVLLLSVGIFVMPAPSISAAPAAGCTQVIVPSTVAVNSPLKAVLALVQGNHTVTGIFRYNNTSKHYDALYFSTASAPTDATTVNPNQSIFICGNGSGTFPNAAFFRY